MFLNMMRSAFQEYHCDRHMEYGLEGASLQSGKHMENCCNTPVKGARHTTQFRCSLFRACCEPAQSLLQRSFHHRHFKFKSCYFFFFLVHWFFNFSFFFYFFNLILEQVMNFHMSKIQKFKRHKVNSSSHPISHTNCSHSKIPVFSFR